MWPPTFTASNVSTERMSLSNATMRHALEPCSATNHEHQCTYPQVHQKAYVSLLNHGVPITLPVGPILPMAWRAPHGHTQFWDMRIRGDHDSNGIASPCLEEVAVDAVDPFDLARGSTDRCPSVNADLRTFHTFQGRRKKARDADGSADANVYSLEHATSEMVLGDRWCMDDRNGSVAY